MSRVYWHSRGRDAELHGSERAWLAHVAYGPAQAAWDLGGSFDVLERAVQILSMVPEVPDGEFGANYLHRYMREAVEQDKRNMAAYSWKPGDPPAPRVDRKPIDSFIESLKTRLRGTSDLHFEVAGHRLNAWTVGLNTALAVGAPLVQLAAKIHGQCEIHAYVEGEDRAWLAGIIDEGLDARIYRSNSKGWEDVRELLRERDDGPVVMSYSVCDKFPSARTHPEWPGRKVASWDDYTEEEQQKITEFEEQWHDTDSDACWAAGLEWLRTRQPWARLSPDTLGAFTFGRGVTVYDLLAPDRDQQIAALVVPTVVDA